MFSQADIGSRGVQTRRGSFQQTSEIAIKRGSRAYNNENSYVSTGRPETKRSPRLSAFSTATNKGYGTSTTASRGAFADITNRGVTQTDRFKPSKPLQQQMPAHSMQPPAPVAAREAVATQVEPAPVKPAPVEEPVQKPDVAEVKTSESPAVASTDLQSVREYKADILERFFSTESLTLPRADYMNLQNDITPKMRMILMDWLIEVHMKYRLRPETLHLTVNLVDRYLSHKQINRKKLQLVGVVAMFVASKFEEIAPPEIGDWVYITDNAYTKDDVLLVEVSMLQTLSFNIVVPTAAHFFDVLAAANSCDEVQKSVAQYLLELALLDTRMLQYTPSHVVSAALLLSNELFKRSAVWPEGMSQQAHHAEPSLRQCVEELRQLWLADRAGSGGQLQAVHKKFSRPENNTVATMSL